MLRVSLECFPGQILKILLKFTCPSLLLNIEKNLFSVLLVIFPHLDYCSAMWGCIGNGVSQKLEKLQNRAARIITGSGWDVRSALKWESLAHRCAKQLKSLMFKTTNTITDTIFGAPNITCLLRGRTLRPSRRVFVIGAHAQ